MLTRAEKINQLNAEIAEVYYSDLASGFRKIKKKKSETPAWAWKQPKSVWVLHLYFNKRLGVREIARRIGGSPGYVSKTISTHRRVLENHLSKVFPIGTRRTYFYEKYFNQLTVMQIADKYNISHQAVSKSIRRTSKKIIKSLRETVAFSQRIKRNSLSQNRKNIFYFLDTPKNF